MNIVNYFSGLAIHGRRQKVPLSASIKIFSYYATKSAANIVTILKNKLENSLEPEFLEVINESNNHNVPEGSASHIRVIIVSPLFNGKKLVQRHRLVNEVLQEELKGPIHALSIQAISTTEVTKQIEKQESPPCRGGPKK